MSSQGRYNQMKLGWWTVKKIAQSVDVFTPTCIVTVNHYLFHSGETTGAVICRAANLHS